MIDYNFTYNWTTWKRKIKNYFLERSQKKQYLQERRESIRTLEKIDRNEVPVNLSEIRLFAIMRNESLRLPHFLNYYKDLGVDRFFFIDNNSTDNSAEILLEEKNIHLFRTKENYKNHWHWMEYLLDTFAENYWCIVVDIDELFSFPYFEDTNVKDLTKYLDSKSFTSVSCLLLDMYCDESIEKINYNAGENPLEVLTHFDRENYKIPFIFFDKKKGQSMYIDGYTGGMRERVFGRTVPPDILSKVPLFRYSKNVYLMQGMHAITGTTPSDLEGIVFHTKFLQDFLDEVEEEVKREQHYDNAIRYKQFQSIIKRKSSVNLYFNNSVKYVDSRQLVDIGLMKPGTFVRSKQKIS